MRRLLLLIILSLLPGAAWGAIAFDAGTGGKASSAASLTYAHTVSGSDRVLYVCTFADQAGGPGAVSSVTYNGTNLTRVQTQVCYESGRDCLELWRLVAPATGSNNIVVTYPGSINLILAASTSYTGVDQTTPEDTPATNSDTSGSSTGPITVNVSSAVNDLVIDCASPYFALTAPTVGASQTKRGEMNDTGTSGSWVGMSEEAGAGTVTMSWTLTTTPRQWGTIGVSLNPAGGGGGAAAPKGLLLGVYP